MRCNNVERKCEWEGTVGTLEKHMATCQFTLLPCPKECKDDNGETSLFMRKDLDDHLEKDCPNRDYECQYCGEKGTYAEITEVHKTCVKKIIPCCNAECKETVPRGEVDKHVESECEHTVIACKYESIGCGVKRKRRDMAAHEQDNKQLHLDMAMDTTLQLKSDVAELRKDLHSTVNILQLALKGKLEKDLQSAANILQLTLAEPTYKLTDYQKKKEDGTYFRFPPFYSHPRGYHMALRVHVNGHGAGKGTHVSVYACIMKGDHDAELNWPFVGNITFTLLNQLEDKNHHSDTIIIHKEDKARVGISRGRNKFIPHSSLAYDRVRNTQYLKDDTLYFRMSVDAAQ